MLARARCGHRCRAKKCKPPPLHARKGAREQASSDRGHAARRRLLLLLLLLLAPRLRLLSLRLRLPLLQLLPLPTINTTAAAAAAAAVAVAVAAASAATTPCLPPPSCTLGAHHAGPKQWPGRRGLINCNLHLHHRGLDKALIHLDKSVEMQNDVPGGKAIVGGRYALGSIPVTAA